MVDREKGESFKQSRKPSEVYFFIFEDVSYLRLMYDAAKRCELAAEMLRLNLSVWDEENSYWSVWDTFYKEEGYDIEEDEDDEEEREEDREDDQRHTIILGKVTVRNRWKMTHNAGMFIERNKI